MGPPHPELLLELLSEFGESEESGEQDRSVWLLSFSCYRFLIHQCPKLYVCSGVVGLAMESRLALAQRSAIGHLVPCIQGLLPVNGRATVLPRTSASVEDS